MTAIAFEPDAYQLPHNAHFIGRKHIPDASCWCQPFVYMYPVNGRDPILIHRSPYAFVPAHLLIGIIEDALGTDEAK